MRTSLLAALVTLLLASFSSALIHSVTAPSTVRRGEHLKISFRTESFIEQNRDYAIVYGFHMSSCFACIGTPAGSSDLVSQGHDDTGPGTFTETIEAPTTLGAYNVTIAIVSSLADLQHAGLRFFFLPITVTH
ncbi:hypothetical protein FRB97_003666 [Tulasnella sp. 331]|nr:hypothetical protein FRB97_003666 [Tulasnella sp. 331]